MWLEPGDKSGMQRHEVTGSRDLVTRGFINHLKNVGFFPEGNEKPRRALNTEVRNLISVLKHRPGCCAGSSAEQLCGADSREMWESPE